MSADLENDLQVKVAQCQLISELKVVLLSVNALLNFDLVSPLNPPIHIDSPAHRVFVPMIRNKYKSKESS